MSEIGVGLVGYRFMGRAHSNAYRQVARFFDVDPAPRMVALCGRNEAAVREAAASLGWEGYETDYGRMLERDDIHLVDISSSGDTHHEFAVVALEAGKHVLCEKPLANTLAEAEGMAEAAATKLSTSFSSAAPCPRTSRPAQYGSCSRTTSPILFQTSGSGFGGIFHHSGRTPIS